MIRIFSAAVADYTIDTPERVKVESLRSSWTLNLTPTQKVIDVVRKSNPELMMITFKYLDGVTHSELINTAEKRLDRFEVVIANRQEDQCDEFDQVAWLLTKNKEPYRLTSKKMIAQSIVNKLKEKTNI